MSIPRRVTVLVAASVFAAAIPETAGAQRGLGPESAILLGPAPYDLAKSGTGLAVHLGLALRPAPRVLLLEPALGFFFFKNDFGHTVHWFFPELSLQAETVLGPARPYLGGGAGFGVETQVGSDRVIGTLHAGAGLRLRLGRGWGARAEARWRGAPPGSGHLVDLGLGIVRGGR